MNNRQFVFSIAISREEYLKYYSGHAAAIRTKSYEGLIIEFPARALTPWITHSGIQGTFSISFDENNKLTEIKRI